MPKENNFVKRLTIRCKGRNAARKEVLPEPVYVIVTIAQPAENENDIFLSVECPHNTGGHGQRCKASHPEIDKVGDGIACPYAVDIPYASDNWHKQ